MIIAVGSLAVGLFGSQSSPPGLGTHLATPKSSTVESAQLPWVPIVLATSRSAPVSLRIPAIGLAVAVSQLGLNQDGTVQVPTDFQEPGWFRLGPTPGQIGSAVILGHVDSYQGPAVFFQLKSLKAGDPVEVTLADGVSVNFVVSSIATYLKSQFPDQQVYGPHGYGALQLVTCGGAFDTTTKGYLSNVVVYTTLVSTTRAPAPA